MLKKKLLLKLRVVVRSFLVSKLKHRKIYYYMYPAYIHSLLSKQNAVEYDCRRHFLTARPNPGAGIGHQMANWIAGYWWSEYFGLQFAHIPFPSKEWECFLGLFQNEASFVQLKRTGYKVRRLPFFEENDTDLHMIQNIISSYAGKKVVFLCEQDQWYTDQYGVMDKLREKFYSAPARRGEQLIYNDDSFNLAIHVRRGDIMLNAEIVKSDLADRYQNNAYFINALDTAIEYIRIHESVQKPIHIYLFSQGEENDFKDFMKFDNLHFCLDMGAQESFLHMVYADALITSKSSFSYKPALINRGLKFCPEKFWHGYPSNDDWIILNEEGTKFIER